MGSSSSLASRLKAATPFLVGTAFAVAALLAQRAGLLPDCATIRQTLAAAGPWAWVLYLVAATVTAVVCIPRTVAMVAGAVGFPFWEAVLLITVSSQLSAVISFAITRGFGKRYIEGIAQRKGWLHKLTAFVHANELSFVVLMRFVHFLPYAVVNYGMGLLPLSFSAYFWGTLIGMFPGTLLFIYLSGTLGCALVDKDAVLPPEVKFKLAAVTIVLSLMGVVPLWVSARRQRQRTPAPPTDN